MRYCAHEARLDAPDKHGVPARVALEAAAARGIKSAATLLEGPEFPEALDYLWQRFRRLNAMRGEGMHGPAPFTPESIKAANDLFRWQLTPLEVEGLCALDRAYRHPATIEGDA